MAIMIIDFNDDELSCLIETLEDIESHQVDAFMKWRPPAEDYPTICKSMQAVSYFIYKLKEN